MAYIVKQPNGLLCRYSHIIDSPTHMNMTEEDYIHMRMIDAYFEAKKELQKVRDFSDVVNEHCDEYGEVQDKNYDMFLEETSKPAEEVEARMVPGSYRLDVGDLVYCPSDPVEENQTAIFRIVKKYLGNMELMLVDGYYVAEEGRRVRIDDTILVPVDYNFWIPAEFVAWKGICDGKYDNKNERD